MPELEGLVIRSQSGFYHVQTAQGMLVCRLRGRLKKGAVKGDIIALGDRVVVSPVDEKTGMVKAILPRQRLISRLAPTPRGDYEQIIMANPDQVLYVFACANPEPHLRMLDRFLVIAERYQIPSIIVANKIDLVTPEKAEQVFGRYAEIGYRVIYTAAKQGIGVEELRQALVGNISALAGPSGVGKSSLLNAVQPGLGLAVRRVSESTGKGKHTTVAYEMFPVEGGGYVADTPGLKSLGLYDIQAEELDAYFPEIKPLVADCQFSDCAHLDEPGCAVIQAVDAGLVHRERYESYLRLREAEED